MEDGKRGNNQSLSGAFQKLKFKTRLSHFALDRRWKQQSREIRANSRIKHAMFIFRKLQGNELWVLRSEFYHILLECFTTLMGWCSKNHMLELTAIRGYLLSTPPKQTTTEKPFPLNHIKEVDKYPKSLRKPQNFISKRGQLHPRRPRGGGLACLLCRRFLCLITSALAG